VSWPMVKLGDVAERVDYGLTASAIQKSDGPRFLRITDLQNDSVEWDEVPSCDCTPKEFEANKLAVGDIVFARTGATTGKSFLIRSLPKPSVFASYLIRVRPDASVDSGYLSHFFKSPIYWNQIANMANGAAQPGVNSSKLKELEIPLPPLAEQKRIAAILDKADAIRRKRQQAIQLADDFLRAVFLEMFGSNANRIEWRTVKFAEIIMIDAPMVDPQSSDYIDLIHIGPDRIEKSTGKLLSALTAREENLISKKFLFDSTYVLYSKIRPYLRKVAMPNFTGLCSADMYPVKPIDGLLTREYLWQLLLSDEFTRYTETLPDRASIPKLNRDELTKFELKLPPIELQKRFSRIVSKYQELLSNNEISSTKGSLNFDSLSQKAFSGQL